MTAISRYRRLVNEAAMEQAIREAVAYRQGRVFHVRRSDIAPEMTDFPDLVVILPGHRGGETDGGVVLFVELKSARRALTDGQATVLAMLAECPRTESIVVRAGEAKEGEMSYDDFINYLEDGKNEV